MIIKILGTLDIVVGLLFWLFGVLDVLILSKLLFILGLVLIVKGIVFMTGLSVVSFLDIVSGFVIVYGSSVNLPVLVVVTVSLFLIQKGVFSLVG